MLKGVVTKFVSGSAHADGIPRAVIQIDGAPILQNEIAVPSEGLQMDQNVAITITPVKAEA